MVVALKVIAKFVGVTPAGESIDNTSPESNVKLPELMTSNVPEVSPSANVIVAAAVPLRYKVKIDSPFDVPILATEPEKDTGIEKLRGATKNTNVDESVTSPGDDNAIS
jgi:hypothetical protein